MAAEPRRQAGFSLMEVLVAFAILALALGTIMTLLATDLRNGAAAADYSRALAVAEQKLTELELEPVASLVPSEDEGELEQRFHWKSTVEPYEPAEPVGKAQLYALSVRVAWQEGNRDRAVQLQSLRIGQLP